MSSKKRYIPIIALGALLLTLLAVLPVAAAGEVNFVVPGDIADANDGSLDDNTPEAQEWTRQGGQVGILYTDEDLDKPIRRSLILGWDADETVVGVGGDSQKAEVIAHSNVLKNVALVDHDASDDDVEILKSGDYVYVGLEPELFTDFTDDVNDLVTVRKVTSVVQTSATRGETDHSAKRYDVTLDAAFKGAESNVPVWRIRDGMTDEDEFTENYRFISTAARYQVVGGSSVTFPDELKLGFPIVASNIGSEAGSGADRRSATSVSNRLGGETDTVVDEDDVLVFTDDGTPGNLSIVDSASQGGKIEFDAPYVSFAAGTNLTFHVAYWAQAKNQTGNDISVRSQATTQAQRFVLRETSNSSEDFAGKINLIPTRVMVTWGDVPMDNVDGEAAESGDTVLLDGGDYDDYFVEYPSETRAVYPEGHANAGDNNPNAMVSVDTLPDFTPDIPRLPVNERDRVTVAYPDGSESIVVETTKPVFANFNPPHNDIGDDSRPTVTAQATDGDSGLEEKKVGILFATKSSESTVAEFAVEDDRDDDNDDFTKLAPSDADADEVAGGFEIEARLSSSEDLDGDGEIWWWVKATDKAGNVAYSDRQTTTSDGADDICTATNDTDVLADANGDSPKCDPFVIKVDNTKPKMEHAETGRWWNTSLSTGDSDDKTEYRTSKANLDSILVIFDEALDPATVQASDFEVNDSTPTGADVYNVKVRDDNVIEEDEDAGVEASGDGNKAYFVADEIPRFVGDDKGYVFLSLAQDLSPNAQPKVEMVDKISDRAGNQQSELQRDTEATDRIAPTLTVSIDEGERPVTDKDVTVRITSNENIGTPQITYQLLDQTSPVDNPDTATDESTGSSMQHLGTERSASARFVSAREYTATITPTDDGLYTVYVTAVDSAGSNKGRAGDNDDDIDVDGETTAILFERDKEIAEPDFDPDKDGVNDTFETDDANGFIRIDYSAEANEYSTHMVKIDEDADPPVTVARSGDDLDTHGRLTIVSATFDGNDISGDLNANTDGNIFQYHLAGTAVGEYDLELTVRDEAGNTNAAAHKGKIKIIERKPYKLELNPGWNLVSLPGQPADTDINAVIPADHPIEAVRGYDPMVPGAWLIAEEGGDGTFSGTLETIEAGTAYWIKTGTFQALEVDIPKPTPGSLTLLPTISISQGWNLVPILDVDGDFELDDQTEGDNYFSGLTTGSVAAIYTYNTVTNSWASVDQAMDDEDDISMGVKIGRGYWVYATKPGVIVP